MTPHATTDAIDDEALAPVVSLPLQGRSYVVHTPDGDTLHIRALTQQAAVDQLGVGPVLDGTTLRTPFVHSGDRPWKSCQACRRALAAEAVTPC